MAYGSTNADRLFALGQVAPCHAQLNRAQEATRAARSCMAASDQTASADSDSTNSYRWSYRNRMYQFKVFCDREYYFDGLMKVGIPVDNDTPS